MQAKQRYILVFLSGAIFITCYFCNFCLKLTHKRRSEYGKTVRSRNHGIDENLQEQQLPSCFDSMPNVPVEILATPQSEHYVQSMKKSESRPCTMNTCFDFTRCYNQFRVYVYPVEPLNSLGAAPPISGNYQKILTAIRESRYYTPDPEQACLFVLGIDTLDRDTLSEDYVRNVPLRLTRLPHWNNGRNHVIFNLYSGTWPDYDEQTLGFDPGEAILAKASMSVWHIRPNFDISMPLFHKQFPLRAGATSLVNRNNFPTNKMHLLAFKGKR